MLNMKQQEIMSTHIKSEREHLEYWNHLFPIKSSKTTSSARDGMRDDPLEGEFSSPFDSSQRTFYPAHPPATTMKSIYSFSYANILKILAVTDKKEGK